MTIVVILIITEHCIFIKIKYYYEPNIFFLYLIILLSKIEKFRGCYVIIYCFVYPEHDKTQTRLF